MRVLIVEDNVSNMDLLTEVLEAHGFEVSAAFDARAGIDQVAQLQPDIVLMDVSLPGLDGLAAARRLRSDSATSHIPIVIMTAHAARSDEANALATGCDGFVTKPINTRTLADTVRKVLHAASEKGCR